MRFDEFSLRIPGDEFRMRFHDRLTVVSGIAAPERDELLNTILHAAGGRLPNTTFRYVDELGQSVEVVCDAEGKASATFADGSPAPAILDEMAIAVEELRTSVRIDGRSIGLQPDSPYSGVHPDLREARKALDEVTQLLQQALDSEQRTEHLRDELAAIDDRIRRAEEGKSRRAYARVLAELERVRAEAAALRGGTGNAKSDASLLERAPEIERLTKRWQSAIDRMDAAAAALAGKDLLPEDEAAAACSIPDDVPEELYELIEELRQARAQHDELSDKLHALAAAKLPEPSDPLVAELARLDQDILWQAHAALVLTARQARLAELGLPLDLEIDDLEAAVDALEQAHQAVEAAEEDLEESKVKLRAQRRLAEATRREQECLARLGLGSYLGFHLRRMEQAIEPEARATLDQVTLEHRLARIRWAELVGDVDPAAAGALQSEVRAYAAAVEELADEAEEIERLRLRLDKVAGPALADAQAALLAACEPFGVADVELALDKVRRQVRRGRLARMQKEAADAAAAGQKTERALDKALLNAGFADGDLAARVGAFRWAAERASERERARESARSLDAVELEILRLEEEANRLRRPEWSHVTAAEAVEPDLDELRTQRAITEAALEAAQATRPNVDHLRDRHRALVRKVGVIEERLREQGVLDGCRSDQVQQQLMAKLTAARRLAPAGISLPVVIDDALRPLDLQQKAEMLDLLERLSERVQVIYLTDDVDVAVWARRRAGHGTLTLLEPVEDDSRIAVDA